MSRPVSDADKPSGPDECCDIAESRGDSGFISSGNLMLSQELSCEDVAARPQPDSGIIEDRAKSPQESMRLDSGVCLSSELSLSEKLSQLSLGLNDLSLPKPPVRTTREEVPWQLYYEQDEDGDTHLHSAIFHGYAEVALALIRCAPHPRLLDTPNDAGETPLHIAVATGQPPVVRWLVIAGARPNPRNAQGDSPLHIASKMGDLHCVRALTDPLNPKHRDAMALTYPPAPHEKPNLEQWNYLGQTCGHVAAEHGHLDILRHLVSCGADINARESLQGLTVLHYALQNRDDRMLQFLLSECRGLNPDMRSYRGKNAWQMFPYISERLTLALRQRGVESPCSSSEEETSDDDEVVMRGHSPPWPHHYV
ncbi:hypothetical protein HUJ04_000024 [Dendroctonus ponderosae]|nr:hypothetical protein HUJ04_000024 [Dendroctonus ponderosae]